MECNDDVLILSGKYRGCVGYVTDIHAGNRVSVRYQSGLGWQTSTYLVSSLELVSKA